MKIRLIESPLAIPRYRQVRLPTVAAELAPFAEVEINDENVEPVDFSPVDLVGFSAQAYNVSRAVHLSKEFRSRGVKTILGGQHATAMPEWALDHFDAVVVGEVEGLGERIVRDLEEGGLGGIYRNESPPDLAEVALPRRDLQHADKYYRFNYPIELSRGCPYGCSFCFARYQYPGFRTRPLDAIAADLAQWDHGMLEIIDLHMAADRQHLLDVCRLFEEAGVKGWFGEATLGSMDDEELLVALERSNCKMVFVGLESIEPRALRSVGKGFNPHKEYRDIIRKIEDHGIFVHAGLIWGLDGSTPENYTSTLEFCEEVGLYLASVNLLTYYPGTRAHRRIESAGRLCTEDLRMFDSAHVTVTPDGMTPDEVRSHTRRFLKRFYSYRSIFRRSFQTPNFRFTQLVDYWAFNLLYRGYYKTWIKRLTSEEPRPIHDKADTEGFAYVGGKQPRVYSLFDASWRFFEGWYRRWNARPAPASTLVTALLLLFVLAGAGGALALVHRQASTHWPVPWPSPGVVAWIAVGASGLCFLLVHRIARAGVGKLLSLVGVTLAQAPLLACALAIPSTFAGWRYALMLWLVILFMKSWSLVSARGLEGKGLLRAYSFVFLFPTLDFAGSFALEPRKRQLIGHLPRFLWGSAKCVAGVVLFGAVAYVWIRWSYVEGLWVAFYAGQALVLFVLLSGVLDLLAAYWRMAGYRVPAGFAFSRRRLTASGIWRGINVPMHDWLVRHVYVPLGGRSRPVLPVMGAFLVSGAFFELMLDVAVWGISGYVLAFFAANGVVVSIDKLWLEPSPGRAAHVARRLGAMTLAAAALVGTAPWFFHRAAHLFM